MRNAAVRRPIIVAGMLGLTGILAAILAAQAAYAVRGHRLAAERVLHDYASLGAEATAQRVRNALAMRFNSILNGDSSIVVRVGRTDSLGKVLVDATAELPSFAYFGVRWVGEGAQRAMMVFQPFREPLRSVRTFTIPESEARAVIAKSIAAMPILPASLTRVAATDSGVGLRVSAGSVTLAARQFDSLTPFHAQVALAAPYADLAVTVSLSDRVAPALVAGGLPRSRMPLLMILLVMSVGLTIAAGDQVRREMALSRLREDFVSSVSHELRTPLAQIRMFAETLRLGRVRTPDEATRSIGIIENEVRRLEHLVENLLHFSRAERSALRISASPTNLSALVSDVASEFAPLAERSGSRIATSVAPHVAINADALMLRQALINLLDNAVKYGPREQTISVGLSMQQSVARITIDDEGSGIAAGERDAIWNRFTRGEAAVRSGAAGTGVGLAIVRDVVALHGGTARADIAPGKGARMTVELPGARVEA